MNPEKGKRGEIIIKRERRGKKSAVGQDLNAWGRETDKQIEASRDRRGRERWMSRFRGQEIRGGDKSMEEQK